ncbi:probable F-box protein At2g36090 [Dendrobium catenatum]|uniref:F-box protein n=1 Tax=Dendrobium catenatum TaxID=906689 RepID=A0A2I0WY04_9ASPA|nr:probable F-box protein At2g36090 [Dendrobium catenatum]XP_028550411.1 probable F-box protein At2g36090 [Dendrobium catenatum]PKU80542.1 F-box protein [Dendrobium catenatum]
MATAEIDSSTSLSSDLLYDILRRLDGPSLAKAACTCADFSSISKEEVLWENACHSLWPSTHRDDVRSLISSIGGFRRFYADCFPLIVSEGIPAVQADSNLPYPDEWTENDYYGDNDENESVVPSDFISIVDVRYKEKTVYSKVLWGITDSDGYNGWFHHCPFRIDLLSYSDGSDDDDNDVLLSVDDGLPPITSVERERKDGKLWRDLHEGIKLSWIIVNSRLKQAANLASWSPLGGQRHWPADRNFLLRFGSILPAKDILPCQVAECIIVMKFSIVNTGNGEGGMATALRLTELSMQLEDMAGAHVNGRNSLLVLKEALSCRRSRNYSQVLEYCHLYLKAQNEFKEEKIRNESWFDRLYIISSIAVVAAFCFCYIF